MQKKTKGTGTRPDVQITRSEAEIKTEDKSCLYLWRRRGHVPRGDSLSELEGRAKGWFEGESRKIHKMGNAHKFLTNQFTKPQGDNILRTRSGHEKKAS